MKIGDAFPLTNRNEETNTEWRDINWVVCVSMLVV